MDIFLQPGEHYVGDADCRIRTLLGSCVSITLWQPDKKIGAMSHFLLSSRDAATVAPLDGRYAAEAMSLMLRDLAREGVTGGQCQAKLFGGGDMFPGRALGNQLNVGRRNGDTARQLVSSLGIPLISESLFGVGHRQIIFDIATGHVWSRQVRPTSAKAPAAKGLK